MDIKKYFVLIVLMSSSVIAEQQSTVLMSEKTIIGHAPYLTMDDGVTKITSSDDDLLSIQLSDGQIFNKTNNTSTQNAPIELPVALQTALDIKTILPISINSTSINEYEMDFDDLVKSPYNLAKDDDDDTYFSGTGSIKLVITDALGNKVKRDEVLNGCDAPYKLEMTNTDAVLSTKYGYPRYITYNANSATYYFKPKAQPQVCYVRANPHYDFVNSKQTTKPYFEHVSKNNSEPHKNFPRTGFDKAFFLLDLADVTAQNIIDTMTGTVTTNGGLTLKLTAPKANQLKVELNGPNHSSTNKAFKPSVVSLKAGNKVIYSFEVSKWFIVRPNSLGAVEYPKDAISYCQSLPNYRMPSVSEITNGNGNGWKYGTPGINNNDGYYTRAIGNGKRQTKQNGDDGVGGLFAEWGHAHSGYYTGSGFATNDFWNCFAAEAQSSSEQWAVISFDGNIVVSSSTSVSAAACVTDGKEHFDIRLSNGDIYAKEQNPSTVNAPIELPEVGQTFNDVTFSAGITAKITDASGATVAHDAALSGCDAPYKLTLSKDDESVDYYFKPKAQPQVCYVRANPHYDFVNSKQTTKPYFEHVSKNNSEPHKNFPRTGFDKAFFLLDLADVTAQNIIDTMTGTVTTNGGLTLKLTAPKANQLKVELNGPNHSSTNKAFKPSVVSLKAGNKVIYSFEVSKWFIVRPNSLGAVEYPKDAISYCQSLPNYRMPSVSEITNGNGNGWKYGTPGINNNDGYYTRAIGNGKRQTKQNGDDGVGGLFAEWGYAHSGYYTGSGFATNDFWRYWASEAQSSSYQWTVGSSIGSLYYYPSHSNARSACVTDGKEHFDIRLSNGDIYAKEQNPSTVNAPIELPEVGQTFNDVTFSAGITAKITDASGATVARDAALSGCDAPYKLTLSKDDESVDYYFKPKAPANAQPQVCYVRANPHYDHVNNVDTTKPYFEHLSKNNSEPHKNFPRTGFDKAFFLLDLANVTAKNVIDTMTDTVTTNGGLTLKLTAPRANQLKVELNGPNHSSTNKAFKPSVVSLKAGNKVIYSFEVSKWFIIRPNSLGAVEYPKDAISYCQSLPNYRMPSVSEMTNGNRTTDSIRWTDGTPGINNHYGRYTRAIGNGKRQTKQNGDDGVGGLFAEWGYAHSGYYTGSGFATNDFWNYFAAEAQSSSKQWAVISYDGNIALDVSYSGVACVTP